MSIIRCSASSIGIESVDYSCQTCNAELLILLVPRDGPPIGGVKCGMCKTIVWFDRFRSSFYTKMHETIRFLTGVQYKMQREEYLQRFIESLPDCPACRQKSYIEIIHGFHVEPDNCSYCRSAIDKQIIWSLPPSIKENMIYWYKEF